MSRARAGIRQHLALVVLTSAITSWAVLFPETLNHWELRLIQLAQQARGIRPSPSGVTVVAIDNFSLNQAEQADLSDQTELHQLVRWPWPRNIYSLVLNRLFAAGSKAVAIDLLLDSPSLHGPHDDAGLAQQLQRHHRHVVLGAQIRESQGGVGGLSLIRPTDQLLAGANSISLGLLNGFADADGIIRQRPSDYGRSLQPTFGEELPDSLATSLLEQAGVSQPALQPNNQWQDLLDPYGPPGSINTYPIWEVLDKRRYAELKDAGAFKNQLVLIGPTATVLQDRHNAVFAGPLGMPGVELHATEVANRLEQRSLQFHPMTSAWAVAIGIAVLVSSIATDRWKRPLSKLAAHLTIALGAFGIGLLLISSTGLTIWLFSYGAAIVLAGITSSSEATLQLQWQRRRLRNSLERYLSPAIAAEIAAQPEEADGMLGGKEVDVVILMSDIRRFTAITQNMSEQGKIPELVERLNQYFSCVVETLHAHGATVDKFIGDACLAVFGTPRNRGSKQEVSSALEAAIEIGHKLDKLNQHWQGQGDEPWEQVIALSYGKVISGNIGSSSRMDYTVIGDAVNTASRLESIAKATNQTIVLSQSIVDFVEDQSQLIDLGCFDIRGQSNQNVYAWKSGLSKPKTES